MIQKLADTETIGTCCHWSVTAKAGTYGASQEF